MIATLKDLGIILPVIILFGLCLVLGGPLLMLWALQLIGVPVVINLTSWFGMLILLVGIGGIKVNVRSTSHGHL